MLDRRLLLLDKERMCDALLNVRAIHDLQTRNLYVSELQAELEHSLVIQRYPDARHDIWSVLSACEAHPTGLHALVQVFRSIHGDSTAVLDLENILSDAENRTRSGADGADPSALLAQHQRESLADLLVSVGMERTRAVYREVLPLHATDPEPPWSDVVGLTHMFEASSEPGDAPGRLLRLVDRLAHSVDAQHGLLIHQWIDAVGTGLGLTQHYLRKICVETGVESGRGTAVGVSAHMTQDTGDILAELPEISGDVMIQTDIVAPPQLKQESVRLIWGGVPIRNPDFTGREELLRRLRELIADGSKVSVLPQALHGFGGVGKTQLAIEYVYRYASEYDLVWWLSAELPSQVRASLGSLGERLGLSSSEDLQLTATTVLDALGVSSLRWLIVYDNADQPDDVAPLLPSAGGHVILTSRNQAWAAAGLGNPIEVDVFEREESIQLLRRRRSDISREDADTLAEKLGDLPLALDQAAIWQAATGMPVGDYLELFDEHARDLLDEGKPATYPTTVYAFLKVALDRLRDESAAAAQMLDLFAYLGHEPLTSTVLRSGRIADIAGELAKALQDPIALGRVIRELRRYGLAKVDPSGQRIQVHRLVQLVLREGLRSDRRDTALANVQALLASANPRDPLDPQWWPVYAEIGPHVQPAELINAADLGARRVVLDQARYLFAIGDYRSSKELSELAVETWAKPVEEGGLGYDHEFTLVAQRRLANALRLLGENGRALELDRLTYQLLRDHADFGEDHEHTLNAANGLAVDLRVAGDFERARALDEDNLSRHVRVFGEDAQETLDLRNSVAVNLRILGNFDKAYEIDLDVASQWEQTLGKNDPRALLSVSNLARDLYGLGRYDEALETQQQALPLAVDRLGARHNHVLLAARTIAIALRKLGRYAEAVKQARENYRTYYVHFGADHEHTLAATISYANCLRTVGELPEAHSLAAEAVGRYERVFGMRHPLTLAAQVNLAIILRAIGEHRRAYKVDDEALSALRDVLGPRHPYTLCTASNLATDLVLQHDLAGANDLSQRTLALSREVRRAHHPYTLSCAVNAAFDLQSVGDKATGTQLFSQAIEGLRAALGDAHPEVLDANRGKRAECDIEPQPT